MRDIPAYPYNPPLAVLFMRYAKGEIDNLRYQEMLTHLSTYCTPNLPSTPKEAPSSPEPQKTSAPSPKPAAPPGGQKPPASSPPPAAKPPEAPQTPDPYRLNFAAVQNPPSPVGDVSAVHPDLHGGLPHEMDIGGLRGPGAGVISEQQVMMEPAQDTTAERGSYHITDISASAAPVTVLVKPDMEIPKKETTISFKQNLSEVQPKEEISAPSEQEAVPSAPAPEPDTIISEVATSPSGNHQKIKALIKQGKYHEAITRLDEMLLESSDDYRSLFLKSIALFNIGKGDEALEILSKAKESCTNKDDAKEIERIYSHIVQKGGSKNGQKKDKEKEPAPGAQKDASKVPSLTTHPERVKNEHSDMIEKICNQAQGLIDSGDYKGANDILADIQNLVKDIPVETMQKESIDDLFAAKGFVLYQLKEFCEAKKFFKEATRINPKNETAIHYLNDIRVRDCNKFVRHV